MPLTETEATKFWPVRSIHSRDDQGERVRFALLKEYAKDHKTATDQQADSFIKRWLVLDQDNTQLRLKYIPEFEKAISHKNKRRYSFRSIGASP